MRSLLIFFLVIFQSCSMYKDHFECPIPDGTPCMSVTQIESMIVEKREGPDLFVLTEENNCACAYPKMMSCGSQTKNKRRIWLCTHEALNGVPIKGKSVSVQIEGKKK